MRLIVVTALPLILSLVVPASAFSQDQAPCAFDTAARIRPDTLILGLAPAKEAASRELRADYRSVAEAIRDNFNRPTMLGLPFAVRVVGRKSKEPRSSFAPFGLHGFVRFQLDTTGKLTNAPIVVSSASPDIIDGIVAAIQLADSNYAFPVPSKDLRRENGQIVLRFVDTVRTKESSVALLRLIIPTVVAESDPAVLDYQVPRYPPRVAQAGVSGRVLLEFIIGPDSVMEPGSLQLLEAPHSELATVAVEAFKTARFRPAKIGGCVVPALVRLPVDFKLRRADITGTVQTRP